MKYLVTVDGRTYTIEINADDRISVDGREAAVDFHAIEDDTLYSLLLDNFSYEAFVEERDGEHQVLLRGRLYTVDVQDEGRTRLLRRGGGFAPPTGEISIKAPMPGLIVAVPVAEGEHVRAGQNVVILESMKMENELKAPRDGVVGRVRVQPRDRVERGQVLVTLS
jgi:biotin carboxyl carrier protein